ncbi:MAG: NAAT family transporter [Gammaproteobacteria bacterium]|nr:NAAT family transporter [Gammaproteobacteria bacterium]MCP5458005.1 NAAT family transporter [Gammaproteobacteria bacterium]
MQEFLVNTFMTFLVVIDPLGLAPLVAAMTHGYEEAERRRMVFRATAIATGILFSFAFGGDYVLASLGISFAAFRIAGGILLFLVAIDMLFARQIGLRSLTANEDAEAVQRHDISVFPLAIPLLAGPGAIASVLLLMGRTQGDIRLQAAVLTVLLGVLLLTLISLLLAGRVVKVLGVTGINVVTRVLGILLAALAAQFVLDGFREAF